MMCGLGYKSTTASLLILNTKMTRWRNMSCLRVCWGQRVAINEGRRSCSSKLGMFCLSEYWKYVQIWVEKNGFPVLRQDWLASSNWELLNSWDKLWKCLKMHFKTPTAAESTSCMAPTCQHCQTFIQLLLAHTVYRLVWENVASSWRLRCNIL